MPPGPQASGAISESDAGRGEHLARNAEDFGNSWRIVLKSDCRRVWESPNGYLRCSHHQVFALNLIRSDKRQLMVPYSAIDGGDGSFNGDRFVFQFYKGETPYEAIIEGTITHMQRVADKIAGGKAEMIRANGDEIRSITWEQAVEEEK